MLDQAFEALAKYDWGMDPKVLAPIDEAVNKTRGDVSARKELETRLEGVLKSSAPRDAKDYVCRKLMIIGGSESVPALAALLPDKDLSHMARFALERIPVPEAEQALRDALPKVSPELKVGILSSLGDRGDNASVPVVAALVAEADEAVAVAAALALGAIRTADAAKALAAAKPASDAAKAATVDASLACAERLLAGGKRDEALAIYKSVMSQPVPKHVKLAATRGMIACTAKKAG